LGGTPQLRNDELVVSGADRYRLKTVSAGKVYANLTVVFKDFAQFGIY
jgi:B9 domain-containing protein 2